MRHDTAEFCPDLQRVASEALHARGLATSFPVAAQAQLVGMRTPADEADAAIADLTDWPWCSIDDEPGPHGIDHIACCEPTADGAVLLHVAVSDVDALVKKGSPLDLHAWHNTRSIEAVSRSFAMLPERLGSDLASLNPGQPRLALVLGITLAVGGDIIRVAVRRARVQNQARLPADVVAAWLEGGGDMPAALAESPALQVQVKRQDALGQRLRAQRRALGALTPDWRALGALTAQPAAAGALTADVRPAPVAGSGGRLIGLDPSGTNRARQLLEEQRLAAGHAITRFLAQHRVATLHRVLDSPERWQQIVAMARACGQSLPDEPDGAALARFLAQRRRADPVRHPDLLCLIVQLMGSGIYRVASPGTDAAARVALAVGPNTHGTAPSRRCMDLLLQRQLKAVLAGAAAPYSHAELAALADHGTRQEDAVRKVERALRKCEAALYLQSRLGERFDAIVTGNGRPGAPRGGNTWLRLVRPALEGRLVVGATAARGLPAIGERLRVKLVSTDAVRGFIDFASVG